MQTKAGSALATNTLLTGRLDLTRKNATKCSIKVSYLNKNVNNEAVMLIQAACSYLFSFLSHVSTYKYCLFQMYLYYFCTAASVCRVGGGCLAAWLLRFCHLKMV